MQRPPANVRKIIVGVIGFTVLLFGIALLVLPGPAFVVIPIGIAILASEFAWARRILKRVKKEIKNKKNNISGRK
jgi:tellurite resistance protein TerC